MFITARLTFSIFDARLIFIAMVNWHTVVCTQFFTEFLLGSWLNNITLPNCLILLGKKAVIIHASCAVPTLFALLILKLVFAKLYFGDGLRSMIRLLCWVSWKQMPSKPTKYAASPQPQHYVVMVENAIISMIVLRQSSRQYFSITVRLQRSTRLSVCLNATYHFL